MPEQERLTEGEPLNNWRPSGATAGEAAPYGRAVGESGSKQKYNLPNFEFQQPDGKAVHFTTLESRTEGNIVLHFWATWCAPCIHELPELDEYIAAQKPADVTVIPIALDGYQHGEKVQRFLAEHKLENIEGNMGQFVKLRTPLGLRNLPVTIVVKHGEVIHRVDGPVEWGSFVVPTQDGGSTN